jgi:hypothetical protein
MSRVIKSMKTNWVEYVQWRERTNAYGVLAGNLMDKYHFTYSGSDEKAILNCILENYVLRV